MLRLIILLMSMLVFASSAPAQIIVPGVTAPKPAPAPAPKPAPPSGPSAAELERAAFNACATAKTTGPCKQYLGKYPKGSYADIARGRIADIESAPPVVAAPKPVAPPAPTVDREPRLWAACEAGTTVAPCTDYLGAYPSGRWADNARARINALNAAAAEKAAFAQCQTSTAPGLCETFVATYPNSSLVAAAKAQSGIIASQAAQRAAAEKEQAAQRAAAEKEAAAQRAAAAKAEAAQRAATEKEVAAAREAAIKAQAAVDADKTAFALCQNASAAGPCQAYLDASPNGAFRAPALAKIKAIETANAESVAWDACRNGGGAEPCVAFGRSFPASANAGQAAALARERSTAAAAAQAESAAWAQCEPGQSVAPCSNYLNAYRSGPHAQAAQSIVDRITADAKAKLALEQEQASWGQCEAGKTVLPCQQYLGSYPSGRFAAAAQTKIKVLETAETDPEMVPALGIIVKRNNAGETVVVSVQQFSSAMGNVFGGDVILKINDQPTNPRDMPRAALETALGAANGRVKLLIRRGPAAVTAVIRARP